MWSWPFSVSKMDTQNGHQPKRWKQYIRTLIYPYYVSSFSFLPCGQSSLIIWLIQFMLLNLSYNQSLLLSISWFSRLLLRTLEPWLPCTALLPFSYSCLVLSQILPCVIRLLVPDPYNVDCLPFSYQGSQGVTHWPPQSWSTPCQPSQTIMTCRGLLLPRSHPPT